MSKLRISLAADVGIDAPYLHVNTHQPARIQPATIDTLRSVKGVDDVFSLLGIVNVRLDQRAPFYETAVDCLERIVRPISPNPDNVQFRPAEYSSDVAKRLLGDTVGLLRIKMRKPKHPWASFAASMEDMAPGCELIVASYASTPRLEVLYVLDKPAIHLSSPSYYVTVVSADTGGFGVKRSLDDLAITPYADSYMWNRSSIAAINTPTNRALVARWLKEQNDPVATAVLSELVLRYPLDPQMVV